MRSARGHSELLWTIPLGRPLLWILVDSSLPVALMSTGGAAEQQGPVSAAEQQRAAKVAENQRKLQELGRAVFSVNSVDGPDVVGLSVCLSAPSVCPVCLAG